MERNRPRTSVVWEGITFVPITGRKREAKAVVHNGRIFALCPDGKIAVDSESFFKGGKPDQYFAEAVFKLGAISQERYDKLKLILAAQNDENCRKRKIRDLKNAIEETGIESSSAQDKAIKEFYPDWGFKP